MSRFVQVTRNLKTKKRKAKSWVFIILLLDFLPFYRSILHLTYNVFSENSVINLTFTWLNILFSKDRWNYILFNRTIIWKVCKCIKRTILNLIWELPFTQFWSEFIVFCHKIGNNYSWQHAVVADEDIILTLSSFP